MRSGALALLLLAACGPAGEDNGAVDFVLARSDRAAPLATLRLASGGNDCTARWNGEAVTREQVLDRGVAAVERAIASVGGVQNITEETIPVLWVEAPSGLRFACLRSMLDMIERAGVPRIALMSLGDARGPAFADFPISDTGTDTASYIVNIGPDGAPRWNGEAIDVAGLRTRARSIAERGAPAAPGEVAVVPDGSATFASLYEALLALGEAGVSPMLSTPSQPPPPP
jgi:biopolymer transport protein ExbD